jgi:hypothetical protein
LVEKHIYLIVETKELTLSASKKVNTLAMEFASLLKCFLKVRKVPVDFINLVILVPLQHHDKQMFSSLHHSKSLGNKFSLQDCGENLHNNNKSLGNKSMQKCNLSYKAERQILSLGKQNDSYTQSPQLGSSHTSVPTGNASFHSIDCQHSNKSSMNMEEQHYTMR